MRRALAALALVIVASGCPARGPTAHSGPSRRVASARSAQLVGQSAAFTPSKTYDTREPCKLGVVEQLALREVRRAAVSLSRVPPSTDEAIRRATVEICRGLPRTGPPAAALVEFGLRTHGLVEPPPHMVISDIGSSAEQAVRALGSRLAAVLKSGSYNRVGIAMCRPQMTPDLSRLVIALAESRVQITPIPRAWKLGAAYRLAAQVDVSYSGLQLVVADPAGKVNTRAMIGSGSHHHQRLRCRARGVYRVEITGRGKFGSEVLANFPIYCGRAAPTSVRFARSIGELGSVAELEAEVVRLTNERRRRASLPVLLPHAALAKVARAHSLDMKANNFVGHLSPTTGSPASRVKRAKIPYMVVRENVARAYSPSEAIIELMNSPAHRGNILSDDVTHIGVGVVVDSSASTPVLLVTQNFIRPATPYNPATAQADALEIIRRARRKAGARSLVRYDKLEVLAERYVKALTADKKTQAAADAMLSGWLKSGKLGLKRVDGLLVKLTALESLASAKELLRRGLTHVGLAVARTAERVVVFVLFGKR
ncbi:MAG: hypothetical protein KC503_17105 [Myxococcales bacterium]|nr:hypothetical protein [Myxococcales bacterium]